MRTKEITIHSSGEGMNEALELAESVGAEAALTERQSRQLRLLTEELLGMLRAITGDAVAQFWIEREDRLCRLHLAADPRMDKEMRRQLLSAASSGENAAAKGFMGRLREAIAGVMLPERANEPTLFALGAMSMSSPGSYRAGSVSYEWSLRQYREAVGGRKDGDDEASAAWDELEKSIVANIADEVSVGILGDEVEMIVTKAF